MKKPAESSCKLNVFARTRKVMAGLLQSSRDAPPESTTDTLAQLGVIGGIGLRVP